MIAVHPHNMSTQFNSKAVLPATGRAVGKDLDKGGIGSYIFWLQIVNLFKNLGRVKLLAAFGKG